MWLLKLATSNLTFKLSQVTRARVQVSNFEAIAHHFIEMDNASNTQLSNASKMKDAPRTTAFEISSIGQDQSTTSFNFPVLFPSTLPINPGTLSLSSEFLTSILQFHLQWAQLIHRVGSSTI